jgi:hypothetical protein
MRIILRQRLNACGSRSFARQYLLRGRLGQRPLVRVTQVDLGIGPQGSCKTFTETTGTNAWAYSWEPPC